MSNINQNGFEFDWDSAIEHDGQEFVVLPEGEYEFEVVGFERQRYTPAGNSKVPPCPMALIRLRMSDGVQTADVEERLYLHSSFEWKLCQFFTCIGQRKKGDRLVPNWRAVMGARGKCRLSQRTWTDRNGGERKNNQVSEYLEPDQSAGNAYGGASAYGGGF